MWVEKGERQFYNRISFADYSELRSSPIDWTAWMDLLLLLHPVICSARRIHYSIGFVEHEEEKKTYHGEKKGMDDLLG